MAKLTTCIETSPTQKTITFAGDYLSLAQLSAKTGMYSSLVSRIFAGVRLPSLQSAIILSRALNMTIDEFLAALEERTGRKIGPGITP